MKRFDQINVIPFIDIMLVLLANGKIKNIQLKKKSGSRLLDKAAIKTIKKISGKVRFPASIQRQYWTLLVPIKYRLG